MTRQTVTAPPLLATWLVAITLPRRDREVVLGDLHEAFERMMTNGAPVSLAHRWYWKQALGSVAPSLRRRVRVHRSFRQRNNNPMFSMLWRDFRFAGRSLRKQPAFSLTVLAMLTLGIAGNTAIFSVFNGLFLRPLPFEDAERLVDLDTTAPNWNLEYTAVNFREFTNWRDNNETFDDMAVFRRSVMSVSGEGEPERLAGAQVSYSMGSVLGIVPELGRHFSAEEDVVDGPKVVQLGHALWRDRYGSDPTVLNRTITLDGESYTIIGVLPPSATFLSESNYWIPLQTDASIRTGSWWLSSIGRLLPGVTMDQARQDLERIHTNAAAEKLASSDTSPVVIPILKRIIGQYRLGTTAMLGAVGIVLLIACANIAGLTLARTLARQHEIAIRLALGAGRWRIARQMLSESVVLATVGALTGTLLGRLAANSFRHLAEDALPSWITFDTDVRVIAFVTIVTAGAALAFGLIPAVSAARLRGTRAAAGPNVRVVGSRGRHAGLNLLVAGEIALAVILLVAAGLSVRDFRMLLRADPGFVPENVLSYRISLPTSRYDGPQRVAFYDAHLERVRGLPGVVSAGAATNPPLSYHNGTFFEVEGEQIQPNVPRPVTLVRNVTPGYLEAIGVTMLSGRSFRPEDRAAGPNAVTVVNETFANHYWPEGNAVGKRIRTGSESDWITIIGVNRDVQHYGLDTEMRQGVYLSHESAEPFSMAILLRTSTDPTSLIAPARSILREMDSQVPASDVAVMTQVLSDSLWARRAASWLVGLFSCVALVLAVGGIYGVISYTVSQHTREIGIRMALGSKPGNELTRVLRRGGVVILAGLAAGLLGSLGVGRVLSSLLVDVNPNDVAVYGGVSALIAVVTIVANYLPARRASTVHPAHVLRSE